MTIWLTSVKPHDRKSKKGDEMAELTKRDRDVLSYIKSYMEKNGTTPTIRDICVGMKLYSTNTVHGHFKKLVDLGYITQNKHNYSVKGMKYVEVKEKR